jgi:hypothetical protein
LQATVAAYIITLSQTLKDVRRGTYCCFDAFQQRDIRIELVMPGAFAPIANSVLRAVVSA